MKTAGIIAEYNPFHNGHKYHINITKESGADAVVCVMSTYFVQRGECAIAEPKVRAQMALKNGADLVLALPLPWACAGAQVFARGAVSILENTGCVDVLSFGSECADIEKIKRAAFMIDDETVKEELKKNLLDGMTFAAARQKAVDKIDPEISHILSNPNDTLGVEYIRALLLKNSKIEPLAVKREGAGHDTEEISENIASASFIRTALKDSNLLESLIPESGAELLENEIANKKAPSDMKKIESAILAYMRSVSPENILKTPDISEGLENRIYSASRQARSLDEVYSLAKSKRYSHARIRRAVMNTFLGVTKEDCEDDPPYIKVLGFTKKGQELLKIMKETAKIPVVMRSADISKLDDRAKRIFNLEAHAADMFALTLPEIQPCGMEYTSQIVIEK